MLPINYNILIIHWKYRLNTYEHITINECLINHPMHHHLPDFPSLCCTSPAFRMTRCTFFFSTSSFVMKAMSASLSLASAPCSNIKNLLGWNGKRQTAMTLWEIDNNWLEVGTVNVYHAYSSDLNFGSLNFRYFRNSPPQYPEIRRPSRVSILSAYLWFCILETPRGPWNPEAPNLNHGRGLLRFTSELGLRDEPQGNQSCGQKQSLHLWNDQCYNRVNRDKHMMILQDTILIGTYWNHFSLHRYLRRSAVWRRAKKATWQKQISGRSSP